MRGIAEHMDGRMLLTRLLIVAAACLAIAVPMACSGSDDHPLPALGTEGGAGFGGGTSTGPCATGAVQQCGIKLGEQNGVVSCYMGEQACIDGVWGECTNGEVQQKVLPPPSVDPGSSPQALGPPSACVNNPCDPYCQNYNEQPDSGVVTEAGAPIYNWPVGSLGGMPTGLVNKGLKEPCKSGLDCQFNTYCKEPQTGSSCEHSKCVTGTGLTSTCDPCVSMICAQNPSCCNTAFTSTCAHDPCSTGGVLKKSCDTCVNQICNVDPYCCNTAWDSICVGEVSSVCGKSCPLSSPGNWSQTCVNAVQTVCDAKCGTPPPPPPPPAPCSHSACSTGQALTFGCHPCVDDICAADPYCCNNWWDSICVGEVNSVCGLSCPINMTPPPPPNPPPNESGQCVPWLPGQKDPACSGIDLAGGVPCGTTIPVCNHGNTTAPAGIKVIHFPANSNQYPKCNPDQTHPQMQTCTTTQPIPAGQCISISCPGLVGNREIMINPPGATQVAECSCLDNWTLFSANTTCGPPSCAGETQVAQFKPVNLYFIVDKSGSMGGGKWTGATNALKAYFQDPGSAGTGAALEFFPLNSGGIYGNGCGSSSATPGGECSATPCQTPMVNVAKLTTASAPTDAQEQALVNAVNAVSPGGLTPTYPALDGSLKWAAAQQAANPNEQYVVVLVTDGSPTVCNTSNAAIAALAGSAFTNSNIRTYTIGMQGANIAALDQIAQQGGTGQAFVIQGTDGTTVAAQMIAAFKAIAGQNITCSFPLPPSNLIDVNNVTVTYTPGSGTPVSNLPKRTNAAGCGTGSLAGWYYNNNSNPTSIELCPGTCNAAQGDPGAKVEFKIGCPSTKAQTKYTQVYEGQCPSGSKPQWAFMAYNTSCPGDSNIVFRARTSTTQAGLTAATYKNLTTAQSTPTNTQICPMSGPSPCPVNLFSLLGATDAKLPWLELEATLNPTSNQLNGPTLNNWQVTYSCPPGE